MTRSFVHNAISFIPFLALCAPVNAGAARHHHHHNHARHYEHAHSGELAKRTIPSYSGWSLTWSDDFTGIAHTLPSTSDWIFDLGTSYVGGPDHWGTGEIQTYTQSTDNVFVDGSGNLNIVPIKGSDGGWTSARLESTATFQCASNQKMRIEARIMLPNTNASTQLGIWPAFWIMGKAFRDAAYNGWPGTGELDVMEAVNGQPTLFTTAHCGVYPGGPCNEPNGIGHSSSLTLGAYHTFALVFDRTATTWQSEFLSWQLDGVERFRLSGSNIGNQTVWENLVHKQVFILFDVAVGGALPNAIAGIFTPTSATVGGADSAMIIDYVAVYNSGTTTTTAATKTTTTTTKTTTKTTTTTTTKSTTTTTKTTTKATTTTMKTTTKATTTTLKTTTKATTTGAIATPSPVQARQVAGCGGWRYVASTDTCASLVTKYKTINLSLENLVTWNPALGTTANCKLTPKFYVCIELAVPKPVQAGQVAGCEGWRYVTSSDTCSSLVTKYSSIGLTLANLVKWNPALGTTSNCKLTPQYYVCVRI